MVLGIIILIYIIACGWPLSLLMLYRRRRRNERKRAPFTSDFLRSPGESLNLQIQELNEEITIHLFYLIILPIVILPVVFYQGEENPLLLSLGFLVILSLLIIFSIRLWRLLNRRAIVRLGYDGERAVGQELNQLMLDGYHVYHDFPADKFNIDHIVVGPPGIFAVETKARSKSTPKGRADAYRVIYDGKTIRYPGYEDRVALEQADRQAKWLRQWLSSAVGDAVAVQPMVALPGWFVERTSPNGIPVLNPKRIKSFLAGQKNNVFSESLIRRIIHQLEQKCRNVEPATVQSEKETG